MLLFRALLALFFVALGTYTLVVALEHGLNLLPVFFGDMARFTWSGQFNADFFCFLLLSGLWLAWRHEFSAAGCVLGVLGVFGGMGLLAPYLFVASLQAKDDVRVLLLGPARAARLAGT